MVLGMQSASPAPRGTLVSVSKKKELFTLYYKDKTSFKFEAKSVDAAIRIAKRELDVPSTASAEKFRAVGGDYILQNSTGNRVYPQTQH